MLTGLVALVADLRSYRRSSDFAPPFATDVRM